MKKILNIVLLISTMAASVAPSFAIDSDAPQRSGGGSTRRQTLRRQIDLLRNRISRAEDDIQTNEERKARLSREITQNNPVPYSLTDNACNCRAEAEGCNRPSSDGGCSTGTAANLRLCITPRGTADCLKVFKSNACVDTLDENGRANVSQCWKVMKWQQVQDADNQIATLRAQIETNNGQMARLEERMFAEDDGDCEGPECRGGAAAKASVARTADRSPTLLDYAPYILGGLGMYLNYSNQSEWREGVLGLAGQAQDIYAQNYANYAATAMRLDQSVLPPTAMGGMFGAMMGAGGGGGLYNYQTAGLNNVMGGFTGIAGQGPWGNIANMALLGGLNGYAGLAAAGGGGAGAGVFPGLNGNFGFNLGINAGIPGFNGNNAGLYGAMPGLYGVQGPQGFNNMYSGQFGAGPYGANIPGFNNMYGAVPGSYGVQGVPGFNNMYNGMFNAGAYGPNYNNVFGAGPGAYGVQGVPGFNNMYSGALNLGGNGQGYNIFGAMPGAGASGYYPAFAGSGNPGDMGSIFGNTAFNGSFVGNPINAGFPGVQGLTASGGIPVVPGFPGVINNSVMGPNVQGGPFSQQFPGGPMMYPGGPVALNGANNASVMNSYGQSAAYYQQQLSNQQQQFMNQIYSGHLNELQATVQSMTSDRARYIQLLYAVQAAAGQQQSSSNYYAAFAAPGSAVPKPPEYRPGQAPLPSGVVIPNMGQ